jgi:ABC-type amino acid transport substrate-binding protein
MKHRFNTAATVLAAALAAIAPAAGAQTMQKVADSNKITVSYREASVPFSYLIGPNKAVGFAVDLTAANGT